MINIKEYLFLLQIEYQDVYELICELLQYPYFKNDVSEATTIQKALDIAVIISYARNFTSSYGFKGAKAIQEELKKVFTEEELYLHDKVITARNKEFAHSDASSHDIIIYENGISKLRVRMPLVKIELELLKGMAIKIKTSLTDWGKK